MKVFVAIPSYDEKVTSSCAQSLMKSAYYCAQHDIELYPYFVRGGIFIDHVRSLMVRRFLQTDCTHLFFIDADLGFESSALAGLVLSGFPFSAGVYTRKDPHKSFNAAIHEPQQQSNGWLRMKRVATGFMCLQRRVLEVMSERAETVNLGNDGEVQMVFHLIYATGKFIGEDYCFCDDYTRLYEEGVFSEPIWAYPDINFDHDGFHGNLHQSLVISEQ